MKALSGHKCVRHDRITSRARRRASFITFAYKTQCVRHHTPVHIFIFALINNVAITFMINRFTRISTSDRAHCVELPGHWSFCVFVLYALAQNTYNNKRRRIAKPPYSPSYIYIVDGTREQYTASTGAIDGV